MAFFHFSQNNSGGWFSFDEEDGITHHVVVEADSAEAANNRALSIGLYFDGCDAGLDCECCGDRWYRQWDKRDGTKTPEVYGDSPEEFVKRGTFFQWMADGKAICVHYADGRKEWF